MQWKEVFLKEKWEIDIIKRIGDLFITLCASVPLTQPRSSHYPISPQPIADPSPHQLSLHKSRTPPEQFIKLLNGLDMPQKLKKIKLCGFQWSPNLFHLYYFMFYGCKDMNSFSNY